MDGRHRRGGAARHAPAAQVPPAGMLAAPPVTDAAAPQEIPALLTASPQDHQMGTAGHARRARPAQPGWAAPPPAGAARRAVPGLAAWLSPRDAAQGRGVERGAFSWPSSAPAAAAAGLPVRVTAVLPAAVPGRRPPAIALRGVTKVYKGRRRFWVAGKRRGSRTAVSGLDLTVEQGQVFGLIGPNGSGKTTTLNMIIGLLAPTHGTVEILGQSAARGRREQKQIKRQMGVVSQETALHTELSAQDNLSLQASLYGMRGQEKKQRIAEMLDMVGLHDRRNSRAGGLSGGMQRRLALIRAMLHDPALLILDEPTVGIDPHHRRAIYNYILGLKAEGKTVVLTTNTLDEAQMLCDQIAIIDHGQLVRPVASPDEIRRSFGGNRLTLPVRAVNGNLESAIDALQRKGYARDITAAAQEAAPETGARTYLLDMTTPDGDTGPIVGVLAQWCDVLVEGRTPSLDDVFLGVTGHKPRD